MTNEHWSRSNGFWIAAAAVTIFVYLFGLTIPLVGPDEPRYAQVAREMFLRSDWVTPTLGGFNWFEKPALLYWLQITFYHIFGVTEFAARFGSALFGLGTIASLWLLGRTVETGSSLVRFSNLLALIAATSIGIIVFARGASFDIILTFPIAASLVGYWIWERKGTTLPLVCFYFFIGVAVLAKGLVGIVFPFAIVTFYHVLSWKFPSKSLLVSLLWGVPLFVAVSATWYLPMYLTHGWSFIDEFFVQHHFQRYTSNKYRHPQPFYFFFWVLPLMTIPWIPFFFAGVFNEAKRVIKREAKDDRELLLFAFAWLLVPLVFFSFSGSKLPGYILPALPPCLIITAVYVLKFIGDRKRRLTGAIVLGGLTFVTIIILLATAVPWYADGDSVKRLIIEANAAGYEKAEVLSQHSLSHNAEFYAAGRLLRFENGLQMRLYSPTEIRDEIRRQNGEPVLVIVPNEWAHQTLESPLLDAELISKNAEHSIIAAREAQP
jgi:4-amino-4-deoxy-L-arabinose transferase-like glycosyltransferase